MKRKGKGKKLLITIVCLVLVAAIGAGIWFSASNTGGEPVKVFSFEYLGMTEYWGDSQESYGFVQTDGVQTVYLSTTQSVTEILVQQGDTVKKGDVLMTFDTTLSDLALERKRLAVEKLKLQLLDAKERLGEINAMRPMVIPTPPEEGDEEDLGQVLTDPYKLSHASDFDGSTPELALICWLNDATAVDDSILDALREKAVEYQTINKDKEPEAGEDVPSSPSPMPTEEPSDPTEAPTDPTEAPTDPTEAPTDPTDPTDPSEPEEVEVTRFYVVFKTTEGNRELAYKTTWQGIYVIFDPETGEYTFQFFDASLVQDHMLAPDQDAEDKPEIDYGSGFTAAQIAEMRSEQQKLIKQLEFDIKMAEAEYKIAQTETADGNVYAQIDGVVVSVLSEDEALMMQLPLIKVSAGGGFYVEGTVSELNRDTMVIGQQVTINDWNTGMTYTGTVEALGDYPSSQDYWNGMDNPTNSYYPFRVFVEDSADLQSGSYVSILFSAGESEHGIYLETPFIRTEGGRSYVYVRGEDGLLEKRYVTTGKSLWGSYMEILEGLSPEDFLAFPYGKNVQPGAQTVESEIRELYE